MEQATGRGFGDPDNPLLVSVRSGSGAVDAGHDGYDTQPRSQCQHCCRGIRQTGDARFGYDVYRRFVAAVRQGRDGRPGRADSDNEFEAVKQAANGQRRRWSVR